jgi:hypothetical protein
MWRCRYKKVASIDQFYRLGTGIFSLGIGVFIGALIWLVFSLTIFAPLAPNPEVKNVRLAHLDGTRPSSDAIEAEIERLFRERISAGLLGDKAVISVSRIAPFQYMVLLEGPSQQLFFRKPDYWERHRFIIGVTRSVEEPDQFQLTFQFTSGEWAQTGDQLPRAERYQDIPGIELFRIQNRLMEELVVRIESIKLPKHGG